ncbi:hypothetical protein [Streptomyces sp. NPDC051994]|uniref:hypothetical protein n=1 Tax=Streptomyces sp. NPDC051994 TaxID=3155287 RepID=UPI00344809B8
MSELENAAREAVDAAANTEQLALIAAVLKAQQITQQQPAPAAQRPLQAHPVGAYLAGGCLAVMALVAVVGIVLLFVLGLAVVATVLCVVLVVLVICLRMLQGMWQDMQQSRD